jgi:enoyl-CoA hydratase/carnithine racemase
VRRIETLDALFIAAIHSHCIGGGLQLALACDFRVARDDAHFGVTAVREGIIPGMGMWRIARHAGLGRAKRLALSAEVVDSSTALQCGLIDLVTDMHSFDSAVQELQQRLLMMAWTSTGLTKTLISLAFDAPCSDLLDTFCEYQARSTDSKEHQDAMAEYRASRKRRTATRT